MKKILVPTDFSSYADHALHVALGMAHQAQAEIILLHTIEVLPSSLITSEGFTPDTILDKTYITQFLEKSKKRLTDLTQQKDAQGLKISYKVELGSLLDLVKDIVVKEQIDLIVMGSKGSSGLQEIFVGSNTQKVVRIAPCPVLVVKNKALDFKVKNIVFAVSLDNDQLKVIQQIKDLQQFFQAKLHLLHVNTPTDFLTDRDIKKKMTNFATKYQVENFDTHVYCDVSQEDGIVDFADDVKADIIVVATHQRRGLAHILSGSIAEDVVNHANKPVYAISLKEDKK